VFSLGGEEVTAPVSVTAQQAEDDDECPILNLELGPISLDLLGLQVDTSPICLEVTATDDEGLLGSLLCDLTGGDFLDGILDLGGILDELGGQANRLLNRLEGVLDGLFSQQFDVTGVFGESVSSTDVGALQNGDVCDILNLSLGPVDLDIPLLGVNVYLHDCDDGPVTVDVTADPTGGVLGSLLCGLADGIDLDGLNLDDLIDRVGGLLDTLIDRAGDLDELTDRQLDRLTDRIDRILGQLADGAPIDRVFDRLENVIERTLDRIDDSDRLDRVFDRLERTIDQLGRVFDRLGDLLGRLV
jgi:hypothetical protein